MNRKAKKERTILKNGIFGKKETRSIYLKTRHSIIGSPERVKIQRSSIPKIRKIHSCVWKLYVKNSQNSQFLPKMTALRVFDL